MNRLAFLVAALALAGCGAGDVAAEPASTIAATPTSVPSTTEPPTPATTSTTTPVPVITTTVEVIPEWMEAFPAVGLPGDPLEICGVTHAATRLLVVVRHPETGETWPESTNDTVWSLSSGQWCWEGEFPAQLETDSGDRRSIEPGLYDIELLRDGAVIIEAQLEVLAPEEEVLTASQSQEDARRDGVIPEIAELAHFRRVRAELEVASHEGTWVLARLSRVVEQQAMVNGCGIGNLEDGVYPIDVVCASEYGEILLVVDGRIEKAYPMPGAVPGWLHITDEHVYSGRIGDGGLPDSTLVRIDRESLEATIVVIPGEIEPGTEWLPGWHIAPDGYRDRYYDAVHIKSGKPGTPVFSWIAEFAVDLDAIDTILAEVAGG